MKHPSNKLQRRQIDLRRSASRGLSRLVSDKGSLTTSLKPRIFTSSAKTTMHEIRSATTPSTTIQPAALEIVPNLQRIERLEKMRARHRLKFDSRPDLVAALKTERQKLANLQADELLRLKEAVNSRRKIPYKGKKWEHMKNENRKRRANNIINAHLKEIEKDPRLSANKNAIASILAFERIKIKPGEKLFDALIDKFETEGNKDAVNALCSAHKLVFEEISGKWADSARVKADRRIQELKNNETSSHCLIPN